ncbi:MAG: hypothetical protein SGPRY_003701 [Prymnesium sp.]
MSWTPDQNDLCTLCSDSSHDGGRHLVKDFPLHAEKDSKIKEHTGNNKNYKAPASTNLAGGQSRVLGLSPVFYFTALAAEDANGSRAEPETVRVLPPSTRISVVTFL